MNWPRHGDRITVAANRDGVLLCEVVRRHRQMLTVRVCGVRGGSMPVAANFGVSIRSEGVLWARGWSEELPDVKALVATRALL